MWLQVSFSQKTTIPCNSDKKCLGDYGTVWYRVPFSACYVTWKRHGTANCFSWVLLCLEFQQKRKERETENKRDIGALFKLLRREISRLNGEAEMLF